MRFSDNELNDKFLLAYEEFARPIRTFAYSCVKQLPGMAVEDIEQELRLLLWRCVQKYDPDRGASFNTLFQGSARNLVISLVRSSDVQKRGKAVITDLDAEAFAIAAENFRSSPSAEDLFMMGQDHGDRFLVEADIATRSAVQRRRAV